MLTIGLGMLSEYSRSRVPRPPQNRTTFMSVPAFLAHPSRIHLHVGDRHHELAPPPLHRALLLHDFVLQVPRQDQYVVRLGLEDLFRRVDGDVGARRESPVLVGVPIDRVVEEVRSDAAVVEQGVPLPGRAVARDGFAPALGSDEEFQQPPLGLPYLLGEGGVALGPIEADRFLAGQERPYPRSYRPRLVLLVARVDSQRAPV